MIFDTASDAIRSALSSCLVVGDGFLHRLVERVAAFDHAADVPPQGHQGDYLVICRGQCCPAPFEGFMPPALPYCHFGGVNFSTMTLRPSRAITRLPSADSGDRTSMVAPRWSAMLCSRASKPR